MLTSSDGRSSPQGVIPASSKSSRRVGSQTGTAGKPLGPRARQREATRARIIEGAIEVFAARGYHGATTRDIATRADVNQGLITHHFRSKQELWRAAADWLVGSFRVGLNQNLAAQDSPSADPIEIAREGIRAFVRHAAMHPELLHFMLDKGGTDERAQWLVDHHLKPMFEQFVRQHPPLPAAVDRVFLPHLFYVASGAGSLIFSVAGECERVTGMDPTTEEAIERHADLVARLFLP